MAYEVRVLSGPNKGKAGWLPEDRHAKELLLGYRAGSSVFIGIPDRKTGRFNPEGKVQVASDVEAYNEFVKQDDEVKQTPEELERVARLLTKPQEGEEHGSKGASTAAEPTARRVEGFSGACNDLLKARTASTTAKAAEAVAWPVPTVRVQFRL